MAALALLVLVPATASAEWQIKPAVGVTLGGTTTFIDLENAVGTPKLTVAVNGTLLGEIFGLEADFGLIPGMFDRDGRRSPFDGIGSVVCDETCVKSSLVTTYTANVVIAVPRRWAEYSLRPYVVGGGGMMRVSVTESLGTLYEGVSPVNIAALDAGGGVTGFLTDRLGLNWDLRWFRSLRGRQQGVSLGREKLSFWRASMALAIRY